MSVAIYNVHLRRWRCPLHVALDENPILLYGEMIVVYDDDGPDRFKIGDGRTAFLDLPWLEDISRVSKNQIGQPLGPVPLNSLGQVPLDFIPENFKQSVDVATTTSLAYTGDSLSPVDLKTEGVTFTGQTDATNPGTYRMAMKPSEGCCWKDGSETTRFLAWEIIENDPMEGE